jgi:hypothetical protein
MNNIIDKWTSSETSYTLYSIIINNLNTFFEELNNIKLINLNKIKYYFYFQENNNTLYLYNLILDNKIINKCKIINNILNKLNIYKYKYITFYISSKKKNNGIIDFKINNKKYILYNFTINDKIYNKKINYKFCSKDINWVDMIPASSVRNYILNDPLLDFLKEYNIYSLDDKPSKVANSTTYIKTKDDDFTEHIKQAGLIFEEELLKIISKYHIIHKVADSIHAKNIDKFNETIQLMKLGIPIIYQGVLHNYQNKTYGIPDLMVRSDYINKLMNYEVISDEEINIKSKNLNINYHYKIIDIKHSQIYLKKDGEHIMNNNSIPAYKSQLYIYTLALNSVNWDALNAFVS